MFKRKNAPEKRFSKTFSRKENIFYIRLTVIIVMAYMLVVESSNFVNDKWSYLYIALYFGSNLLLSRLPAHYFYSRQVYYLIAAFDTLMITLGIFLIGQADSYFFIVYFLIIGISAMTRNLKYLMLNTFMFIIIYAWILYMSGHFQGEEAATYALRIPFIWSFALLIGYILDCVIEEVNKSIGDLQEKYNALVQSIDSPIFMLDPNGLIIYANDKMLTGLGKTRQEVQNRHFSDLHSSEEADLFQNNLNYVLEKNTPVQFVSHNQDNDKWFLNVLSPVKESTTNVIEAASAVSKDITEKVKYERELRDAYERLKVTQDQLIQKNKMEVMGRMASGIAHQVRNPLEIILLGVEFLEELGYTKDDMARQSIEKIKFATQKTHRIIEDVLQFSRSSNFSFEAVNIVELLEESIELIQHKLSQANMQIETDFGDRDLFVQADRTTLQQVILNIMNNAVEAMDKNGSLRVSAYVATPLSIKSAEEEPPSKRFCARSGDSWARRRSESLSCLKSARDRGSSSHGKLGVLLADIRKVNTSTGDITTDVDQQFESAIERRMGNSIRGSDTMTCITPNMYLCLVQDLSDAQTASRVADRLHNALVAPLFTDQGQIQPYVTLGYSIYPDGASDTKQLLQQAKSALDTARKRNLKFVNYLDTSFRGVHQDAASSQLPALSENRTSSSDAWIVVEIQDTGPGMSEEVASNIFEPFYTTKQADKGTGLGLSLASHIIERHQGHIELVTKENEGSTFRVKLLPANADGGDI